MPAPVCWLVEFGCDEAGGGVIYDDWYERSLCRAHGAIEFFRRMAVARGADRRDHAVGLTGDLACSCSLAIAEASGEAFHRLQCTFCRVGITSYLGETRKWERGEPHERLGMLLVVTTCELRAFDRLTELAKDQADG